MKTRDPYPITDVYLLEMNAVDGATVTVGDLCERLSNDFDTGWGIGGPIKDLIDDFKKSNELRNTKFIDAAKRILKYQKVRINGITEKTIKSL